MTSAFVVRSHWIVASPDHVLEDGALLVRGGRIERIFGSTRAALRTGLRVLDCGDAIVAPGLVNAHAHLELGGLAGAMPRGSDFAAWVRAVLGAKAARTAVDFGRDAWVGASRALECGTTTLVDVDSTGAASAVLSRHGVRVVHMREVLDARDPARTRSAAARIARALPRRERCCEGVSPHAPFTVSADLFARVARVARRRRIPMQMHWSETRAEIDWLEHGTGPLAGLLGPSPRRSGLDLLEQAGPWPHPLSLVHGNFPAPGEPERVAALGAVLVHCPGCHAWFRRAPFPWHRYARAGVTIALGTDSLASNADLDPRREMRILADTVAGLRPRELLHAATVAGAKAIGREGDLGRLAAGARADFLVLPARARSAAQAMAELCLGQTPVERTWIAGRPVEPRPAPGSRRASTSARARRSGPR